MDVPIIVSCARQLSLLSMMICLIRYTKLHNIDINLNDNLARFKIIKRVLSLLIPSRLKLTNATNEIHKYPQRGRNVNQIKHNEQQEAHIGGGHGKHNRRELPMIIAKTTMAFCIIRSVEHVKLIWLVLNGNKDDAVEAL